VTGRGLVAALAALLVAGCASNSAPDSFLLAKLDNQAKARALVEEGINQYQEQLIRRGDLGQVAPVREYFVMALRFDSQNVLAARYRDLVDAFRAAQLSRALKQAQAGYAVEHRSDDVTYSMLVAIQTALRLEPANATANRLARDTESLRQSVIARQLAQGQASMANAAQAGSPTDQENADADAWQTFAGVLQIDAQNSTATSQMASIRSQLDKLAQARAAQIRKLIAAGQFDAARDKVAEMSVLNRRVGGVLSTRVGALLYELNYRWARSLYARGAYVLAQQKVTQAIRISATDEALLLKRRINELVSQEERQASFDDSVHEIDDLIQQGDLSAANARIDATARIVKDSSQQDQLDARRQKVRSYLPELYASAVTDYRNEDFKDAIELLQTIVSIDVTYEQAADYLDKAQAKQKLIEEY